MVVCPFVLFLLAIVLSVLRLTDSDYPFWYLQTLLKLSSYRELTTIVMRFKVS